MTTIRNNAPSARRWSWVDRRSGRFVSLEVVAAQQKYGLGGTIDCDGEILLGAGDPGSTPAGFRGDAAVGAGPRSRPRGFAGGSQGKDASGATATSRRGARTSDDLVGEDPLSARPPRLDTGPRNGSNSIRINDPPSAPGVAKIRPELSRAVFPSEHQALGMSDRNSTPLTGQKTPPDVHRHWGRLAFGPLAGPRRRRVAAQSEEEALNTKPWRIPHRPLRRILRDTEFAWQSDADTGMYLVRLSCPYVAHFVRYRGQVAVECILCDKVTL